jgi:hypothetical protein
MKRSQWFPILLLALLPIAAARGQGPVTTLESLAIFIWPDYDRPSVLVLLTGTLAGDEPLPAVVTFPLPEDAQLNAVARIDSQERMIDDISYSTDAGKLTLTTPDPRFQVEYCRTASKTGNTYSASPGSPICRSSGWKRRCSGRGPRPLSSPSRRRARSWKVRMAWPTCGCRHKSFRPVSRTR